MRAKKASVRERRSSIPLSEANLRIARLSRQFVPTACGPERLDRPLDADIVVTGDERAHRIALRVDGVEVSWCVIVDFEQQIGPCLVRMGGLASVGTHDEHRFKGYSRKVLLNSLRWCRQAGYDVGMLYGIPGYYPKFGYAEAFPGVVHSILVRDAELARPGRFRFVDFDETKHLTAVLKMYHANNAGRTGPTRRIEGKWPVFRKGNPWGVRPVVRVGLDSAGRPAAYYAYDGAQNVEGSIVEVGYASPAVFGSLLREIAAWAWAGRLERFRFSMPEDDAFMAFCRGFGMVRETTFRRCGGAMVRLYNVRSAMRKIAPLLGQRLTGERPGTLTLRTNIEDVALAWRAGKVTVDKPHGGSAAGTVRIPQWALAQLLYGYQDVGTLACAGTISGPEAALAALSRMFPLTPHYHYRVDSF